MSLKSYLKEYYSALFLSPFLHLLYFFWLPSSEIPGYHTEGVFIQRSTTTAFLIQGLDIFTASLFLVAVQLENLDEKKLPRTLCLCYWSYPVLLVKPLCSPCNGIFFISIDWMTRESGEPSALARSGKQTSDQFFLGKNIVQVSDSLSRLI